MNHTQDINESAHVPPQAPEVEESVLGTCLVEAEAVQEVVSRIGHNYRVFYKGAHQHIYQAIVELDGKGAPIDAVSVEDELRNKERIDIVGGPGYLSDLTRSVSSSANVDYHCQILLEKYAKRKSIQDNGEEDKYAYSPDSDPYELLDRKMTNVNELSDVLYREQGNHIKDLMEGVMEDIEHRRQNPGINGIPTGMPLDKYTGGWQDANLYLIAARPSIGKTALVLKAAFNAALWPEEEDRTSVFYWNGEMKNIDLIKRRLAVEAQVNYIKMRDGKLSDKEMQRLVSAAGHLYNGNMIIDDTPGIGIHEWRAKFKTAVNRNNVGLGVVDYLQLMSGNNEGTREQEIASISRGLKEAAKETNCPVVALSQLSRECEKRKGAEPYLSDLRESGSLEQDADGVILLNRPEFFGHNEYKNESTKGFGWLKVEKMRNGMTGEFKMIFDKPFAEWKGLGGEYSDDEADDVAPPKAPMPHNLFEGDDDVNVAEDSPF